MLKESAPSHFGRRPERWMFRSHFLPQIRRPKFFLNYKIVVTTHSPGMKYPKKRHVQGIRPAHVVFSEFSSPRLKAWDEGMS